MNLLSLLINEAEVKIENGDAKEEQLLQKQMFNNMINALDGVTTEGGRIIIMTTNNIERFSETFLRPGRIDLKMYISYVTPEVFRKYVKDMYDVTLPKDIELKDDKLTISKLQFDIVFAKMSSQDFIAKYVK
jgi:chaperone BCS1